MRLQRSIAVTPRTISADGEQTFDLGVNPLSVLLIALRPLNDTGTLSEFQSYLGIAGAIDRVGIEHRGQSIVQMSGRDAAAMAYHRYGIVPPQQGNLDTNNFRRCVVLPIVMGRMPFDPSSCLPETKRGDLQLVLDLDIAATGYDGLQLSVESIELLGASPKEFERKVQVQQTNAATGTQDVQLPVGNVLRGMLLFGTTPFTGATPAPSWGRYELRVDGSEHSIVSTDWEVASMVSSLWGRQPPSFDDHKHRTDTSGGGATDPTAGEPSEVGSGGWENYAFEDLDPLRNDMFSVDLSKATSCSIRSEVETADAVRVVPVEKLPVSALAL